MQCQSHSFGRHCFTRTLSVRLRDVADGYNKNNQGRISSRTCPGIPACLLPPPFPKTGEPLSRPRTSVHTNFNFSFFSAWMLSFWQILVIDCPFTFSLSSNLMSHLHPHPHPVRMKDPILWLCTAMSSVSLLRRLATLSTLGPQVFKFRRSTAILQLSISYLSLLVEVNSSIVYLIWVLWCPFALKVWTPDPQCRAKKAEPQSKDSACHHREKGLQL